MKQRYRPAYRYLTSLLVLFFLWPMNSCLKDVPDELPEYLQWDPSIAVPLGDDRFGMNHASGFDTTKLDLDIATGLPVWVDEAVVVMQGTLDFGLSYIQENLDQINGILFRVSFQNGFPEEIFAQARFEDDAGNVIDSMFTEGPVSVPPGNVAEAGELLRPGELVKDSYFGRDRIMLLEEATVLTVKAYFIVSDPDPSLIPYYPTFDLNMHMGAIFDLTLEL